MKKYLNEENTIYKICKWLLVLGLLWLLYSIMIDVINGDAGTFVQRSGSVVVLLGVMVEYLLTKVSTISKSDSVFISNRAVENTRTMPKIYKFIKLAAHIYIVSGTLIWGYIDLLWK